MRPNCGRPWCGPAGRGGGAFDAEFAEFLACDFPDDSLSVPHGVMAIIARRA